MKNFLLLIVCLFFCEYLFAQESFEEYKKRVQQDFLQMKEQQTAEFENYRRKVNLEFAEYVAKSWEAMKAMRGEMPKMRPKPNWLTALSKSPSARTPCFQTMSSSKISAW